MTTEASYDSLDVYSNFFVHTAYFHRDIFDPTAYRIKGSTDLLMNNLAANNKLVTTFQDFAFNIGSTSNGIENSTFMRLNACSLLKLHYWCLKPTDSTVTKVTQYVARFFSPCAAILDVAVNTSLFGLKLLAFLPILYYRYSDSKACQNLGNNMWFHFEVFRKSYSHLISSIATLPLNILGPSYSSSSEIRIPKCIEWFPFLEYINMFLPQHTDTPGTVYVVSKSTTPRKFISQVSNLKSNILDSTVKEERVFDINRMNYISKYIYNNNVTPNQLEELSINSSPHNYKVLYCIDYDNLSLALKGHYFQTHDNGVVSFRTKTSFFLTNSLKLEPSVEVLLNQTAG